MPIMTGQQGQFRTIDPIQPSLPHHECYTKSFFQVTMFDNEHPLITNLVGLLEKE